MSDKLTNIFFFKGLIFILVACCIIGAPAKAGLNYSDFFREAIAEIGLVGLLFYWFYSNRRDQSLKFRLTAARVWLFCLFLWATVSIFWAVHIGFFISKYLLWLATAAMIFLGLTLQCNLKTYIVLSRVILGIAAYIAVIGLLQALFSVDIFAQGKPPAANFVNKNVAAQVIVLSFPLSLFLIFFDRNHFFSAVYPFIVAIILAYIFHTGTNSAWLSVMLQILLIVLGIICYRKSIKKATATNLIVWPDNKRPIMLAIILLLVLVNVSAQGWTFFGTELTKAAGNIYSRIQADDIASRSSNRYLIWQAGLLMIKKEPLTGTGMGSFYHNLITQPKHYRARGELRVHNDLLELGVELGIVGLVLFLGVVVSLLICLYKLLTRGEIEKKIFYLLITSALAGSAFNMQLSFPYQMPVPLLIFGMYTALIVSASDAYVKYGVWPVRPWYLDLKAIFTGLIFVLVVAVNFVWLNAAAGVSENLIKKRWRNNVINNPFACHKTLLKSLHDVSIFYTEQKLHKASLGALGDFSNCIPDTWIYRNAAGINLIGLHHYQQAIRVLEQAKQSWPKGTYTHYFNQFLAYMYSKDYQGARQVHQQLLAQPEVLLAERRATLKKMVIVALDLNDPEQAKDTYKLYRKYHGDNTSLEVRLAPYLSGREDGG